MFEIISEFENRIAQFYGSSYAVSTDSCTHAIELCLRHQKSNDVSCPTQTYVSIPMTFEKLGLRWSWNDQSWQDYYYVGGTNVIDAAVYWQRDGYINGTLMCLSFQFQKHLSLVRGGAILTNDHDEYVALKKLSFDGRYGNSPWRDQDITSLGYHYYMPIETAKLGLEKIDAAISSIPRKWSHLDYPYLPDFSVFQK